MGIERSSNYRVGDGVDPGRRCLLDRLDSEDALGAMSPPFVSSTPP